MIKDLGDKITDSEKNDAESMVKDLKDALEKNDLDDIKSKKDKLQEKLMQLGSKMYEGVNPEGASTGTETNDTNDTKSNENDVKDAEFEEK